MPSTRAHQTSPLRPPFSPPSRIRPRPTPRPPKYSPWVSAAVVRDLSNSVLDIGEKATPVEDISSHVERRMKGQVVFLTRDEDGARRAKERAKKLKERTGGKSRAARKAAWKRRGGAGQRRRADGKFE